MSAQAARGTGCVFMARARALLAATALALLVAACGKGDPDAGASAGQTLTVLAGSELRDIEPMLPDLRRATGVDLKMTYSGTLDAVEQLQAGAPFDVAWLPSGRYAQLVPEVRKRIVTTERTMTTPVVLGLKASKARALGWTDASGSVAQVTWKDIAEAAAAGRLTFAENCQACHGAGGAGRPGFPALAGDAWIWGGTLDAIQQTVTVGVRNQHPDSRVSQMPRYGVDAMLKDSEIDEVTQSLADSDV